ncbi:MAG: hypothetical protein KA408_12305 [Flavobacteriales bacterium]|nr:hypothetical protein [Flavobacteriales bacterium]
MARSRRQRAVRICALPVATRSKYWKTVACGYPAQFNPLQVNDPGSSPQPAPALEPRAAVGLSRKGFQPGQDDPAVMKPKITFSASTSLLGADSFGKYGRSPSSPSV